jgi:hypothetical protein
MSNYTETFTKVNGNTIDVADFETEFDAIAAAISSKLDSDGSGTMTGDLDMGNNSITDVSDPTNDQDAATHNIVGVRQFIVATSTTNDSTNSTSYASTSLSASITPLYSDSDMIISVSGYYSAAHTGSGGDHANRYVDFQIYRSTGTAVGITNAVFGYALEATSSVSAAAFGSVHLTGTETPGSGTHTYVLRYLVPNAVIQGRLLGSSGTQAVMTIMEVRP